MPSPTGSSRTAFTLIDAVAILMLVPLTLAAVAAADRGADERQRRIRCAQNLRQIGNAIQLYANENKGGYPRTIFDPKTAEKIVAFTGVKAADPFKEGGPQPNDVSAPMWLLMRNSSELDPAAFTCPSSTSAVPIVFARDQRKTDPDAPGEFDPVEAEAARKAAAADAAAAATRPAGPPVAEDRLALSNFPGPQYVSYSYTNPYPSDQARSVGFKLNFTLSSDFAVAGDLSPGAGAAKVKPDEMPPPANEYGGATTRPAASGPWKFTDVMKKANSPNHGGFGQNVLYGDGHVSWHPTPFCGSPRPIARSPRDNIFTRQLVADAGGARTPAEAEAARATAAAAAAVEAASAQAADLAKHAADDADDALRAAQQKGRKARPEAKPADAVRPAATDAKPVNPGPPNTDPSMGPPMDQYDTVLLPAAPSVAAPAPGGAVKAPR